ncbi:hypothetical protein EVAR_52251_1 [Eumeta japonica]|uniref:Uncharacterized protein n=1 Tax=Eumeta variegata TaxID=151549 RepID=A0A4C1YQA6_EUMVA|nr:hypothetical protein EVAR_52251_1 [Eumeta japonica]
MSTKSQSRTEEVAASHIKKAQNPRLRTLQSRMVNRPLRVQTDLSEAGSVKAIPTRKTERRSNSDGAQHKKSKNGQASCPSSPQEIEEEAERTKHAQELVRIERTHNKDLTNVVKTLTEELSQARRRPKSLDETKSIRDWLGYETEESKETNKDVKSDYRHRNL